MSADGRSPGDSGNTGDAGVSGEGAGYVALGTATGRWVLAATVGGTGMAFLDGTVVNVALPTIGAEFRSELAGLQWVLNGYMLTLSALILLSGSLGDRYGRLRVFQVGVVWFAAASAACAAAVNLPMLILARVAQGVGGALLTPGSLAIIEASFRTQDRARAIGAWSGLTGLATAVGPFLGGWLVDAGSWRFIFLLNLPLAAAIVAVAARHVPESRNPAAAERLDVTGAVLAVAGLGGLIYALIEAGRIGASPAVIVAGVAGTLGVAAFGLLERRSDHPMLPPAVFSSWQFTAANVVTIAVYAALGAVFFLLVVFLQVVLGYSALAAGAASLPITVLMLVLSARAGQLAQRIGPRPQLTAGPLVMAAGLVLMLRIDADSGYVASVLPAVLVLGLGLSATVAPLTSTVLAAAAERYAGVASGVNNTLARGAQLTAVAVVPLVASITGSTYRDPIAFTHGFHVAMLVAAGLAAGGGVLALVTIRDPFAQRPQPETSPHHCALDAPPLDTCPNSRARSRA